MIKKELITSIILLTALTGCVGNEYPQNGGYSQPTTNTYPSTSTSTPTYPQSLPNTTSNSSIQNALAYMYDEERLAKELYLAINAKQPVQQLSKIATKAEVRHIDALTTLARKYGVSTPPQVTGQYAHAEIQNLFNQLYAKGIRSKRDALEVGCMAEVVDINDLNRYVNEAQQAHTEDVLETFNFLRKGSYNHYWAFDNGLKQLGVSNGCCSLGQSYCHPEYPKKEHGEGRGRGQGRGQGMGRRVR